MIKLSYSQLDTFATCRAQWNWRYSEHLEPKETADPLMIGSAGHKALEAYYKCEEWPLALNAWANEEVAKALTQKLEAPEPLVTEEEGEHFYFESGTTGVTETANLIEKIMERYIQRWGIDDKDYEILAVEERFEIPITSNVTMVGVWDVILKDQQGNLWIMDHKFPGRTFRDFQSLELDAQIGIYQWAALESGYNALGFIFNQVRAALPKVPSINKTKNKLGGYVSIAEIDTDWETYSDFVRLNGEAHLLFEYEQEMRPKLNKKEFFDRKHLYRSPTEISNFHTQMVARVEDFERGKENIFMVPQKFNCGFCAYKGLCIETLKGHDTSEMIHAEFNVRERTEEEVLG